MAKKFIGRRQELDKLSQLMHRSAAKLIVIKGRRRIGKSRLLFEFGKQFTHHYTFSGLPPTHGVGADEQRIEFATQLEHAVGVRGLKTDDWSDLFWHLAEHTKNGKTLVVLDEITWMAEGDLTFLPKLKNAWDLYFKQNDQLILALCGSISGWIEKNILQSTGFLGRLSLNMGLDELPLADALQFWDNSNVSTQDKMIVLAMTGGIPRYLEEINPEQNAIQNISRLCFDKDGILFREFEHIFSDLFSKRSERYKTIVHALTSGAKEAKDIVSMLGLKSSGDIYHYLDDLIMAGFIAQDYTWHFHNGKISKLSHYRIKDNYCRFYLKMIEPNKDKILHNTMNIMQYSDLAGFSSIIGLQFENWVLSNRHCIIEQLGINKKDILCDNPYFQRKTTKQEGCQIDYLIQTRYHTLFICEIKFTMKTIKHNVIDEVQEKIDKLKKPRHFSCVPILIYFGDIQESIEESHYFAKMIDVEKLMAD